VLAACILVLFALSLRQLIVPFEMNLDVLGWIS